MEQINEPLAVRHLFNCSPSRRDFRMDDVRHGSGSHELFEFRKSSASSDSLVGSDLSPRFLRSSSIFAAVS